MKARTPTSAPGNSRSRLPQPRHGFTLIELLLVLALIALASGLMALSLRDGDEVALDREAQRLAALLEAARAEARATGVAVRFELLGDRPGTPGGPEAGFRFVGLAGAAPAGRWLDPAVQARIELGESRPGTAPALRLGPEPLIGAQRLTLSLHARSRVLATDGLAPFAVVQAEAETK